MENPTVKEQINQVSEYQVEVETAPGIYEVIKADCEGTNPTVLSERTCVIP